MLYLQSCKETELNFFFFFFFFFGVRWSCSKSSIRTNLVVFKYRKDVTAFNYLQETCNLRTCTPQTKQSSVCFFWTKDWRWGVLWHRKCIGRRTKYQIQYANIQKQSTRQNRVDLKSLERNRGDKVTRSRGFSRRTFCTYLELWILTQKMSRGDNDIGTWG